MRRWLLLLLALIVVAGAADAQDRLAAARREGKVVWHTALAAESAQRVAARFEQAYPGIKVEVHRTGSVFFKRKGLLARYAPADDVPAGWKDLLDPKCAYPRDGVVLITSPSAIMSFERRTDEVKKRFVDLFGA